MFVFYICCYVIVNMPVIYVCYFANVMQKQVKYNPLNTVYGPYGGRVRPLLLYTKFEADGSIRSKVMRGPKIWMVT